MPKKRTVEQEVERLLKEAKRLKKKGRTSDARQREFQASVLRYQISDSS
jgi:hypothetical protein